MRQVHLSHFEAPIGKINFSANKSYTVDSKDNLLYNNFKVIKEKGMVSENSLSGVWSTSSVSEGYVNIKLNSGTIKAQVGNTVSLFGQDLERNGLLHEYYDPDSGKGVNNPGFQNWNLLVNNMLAWYENRPVVCEF